MVILKKLKSATLTETLLASVLILIIFSIASLTINNVFKGVAEREDNDLRNRVKELSYLIHNNKLLLPFHEETDEWDIYIEKLELNFIITSLHKPSETEKTLLIEK